jgi:mono/diheme cytochrome c family protein
MKVTIAAAAIGVMVVIGAQSQATHSVWDGVYTAEQAKRGQAVYNTQCASCHGDTLGGGESAPPLAGSEFLSSWSGLTVGDLFDRTRSSMPQNKPGSLSREVNADILAYVFSANQFPAGKSELAHATEVLKDIRIVATRPDPKE